MTRQFWRDQKAAFLVSVAGGVVFFVGHGALKGALFFLAVFAVLQVPIFISEMHRKKDR